MGRIFDTTINRFDGGMVNDPRDTRGNVAQVISNFDIFTDGQRMRPYNSSEDGNANVNDNKIRHFAVGEKPAAAGTYVLYGLGIQTGALDAKLFYKNITTGGSDDLDDGGWVDATTGEQQTGDLEADSDLFLYYKKTGKFYGMRSGGQHVWSYEPHDTTPVFTESEKDLGGTNNFMTQGLIDSQFDNMYFGVDNVLWENDNGSFNAKLTLPAHLRIRCLAEYGNFLAIGCDPTSLTVPGFSNSVVFLWDKSSTDVTETIDFGDEKLYSIGNLNGTLISISSAGGSAYFDRRLVFRYLTGTRAVKFEELTTSSNGIGITPCVKLNNNRLNIMAFLTINGSLRPGIWSVSGVPGNFQIVHERTLENDTTFSDTTLNLRNFIFTGDYLFQAWDVSGTYDMSKSNVSDFTATSIYETKLYTTEGSSQRKDLVGVTIEHEALPASGSPKVVVKYKVDDETSYSSAILTSNTATEVSASAITGLPKNYKEITFRLESTGKAVITGLTFKEEVTGKREYE